MINFFVNNIFNWILNILFIFSLIFMLKIIFVKPDSIKSSKEFAEEFHKIAGNEINGAEGRWFAFPFWPISIKNTQILPVFNTWFKGFYFLLDSVYWLTLGNAVKKGKNWQLFFLITANIVSRILILLGVSAFIYNVNFSANNGFDVFGFNLSVVGVFSIITGIAVLLFPSYIAWTEARPVILKTKYSQRDKKLFEKYLKIYIIIQIIAVFVDVFKILSKVAQTKSNRR